MANLPNIILNNIKIKLQLSEELKARLRFVFATILFAGCIAGFTWHSTILSIRYLSYSTTNKVVIGLPDEIPIPTIFIGIIANELCPKNATFNNDLYFDGNMFYYTYYYSPTIESFFRHSTEHIPHLFGPNPKLHYQKLTKKQLIYYTLTFDTQKYPFIASESLPLDMPFLHLPLSTHLSGITTYKIILNSRYQLPYGFETMALNVKFPPHSNATSIKLRYSYFSRTLLGPPYDTNCFDYSTIGLESQGHCVENCMQHLHLLNFNTSDLTLLRNLTHFKSVAQSTYLAPCRMAGPDGNNNAADVCKRSIELTCSQLCGRTDCFTEQFYGQLIDTYAHSPSYIKVYGPNKPIIRLVSQPDFMFMDFFIYVTASAAFWLSLCIMEELMDLSFLFKAAKVLDNLTPAELQGTLEAIRHDVEEHEKHVAQIGANALSFFTTINEARLRNIGTPDNHYTPATQCSSLPATPTKLRLPPNFRHVWISKPKARIPFNPLIPAFPKTQR